MLFQSLDFLVFCTVVVALYYVWPEATLRPRPLLGRDFGPLLSRVGRHRWVLLLAASYFFYGAWAPQYLVWIVVSTLIDYLAAIQIARTAEPSIRKGLLAFSVVANLGLLFAAKYFDFFNDSLRVLLNPLNISWDVSGFQVLLPIGISFYTLQTIGYTIDVYRGTIQPERHLGLFALFVSFFPQLVAGPIERAGNLLPRFRERHKLDSARVVGGLRLMLWGTFKKVVIADRLALYVSGVYDHPTDYQGLPILLATLFFAIQIYCDFSGYTDIALGVGKVMGYDLTQNFRQPYFATSIAAFWRRWHISLSSWFRDYLYIPLGGNRVSRWQWAINITIVFVTSGLWHGASWTFVLWGGLYALYYLLEAGTKGLKGKISRLLQLEKRSTVRAAISGSVTFVLVCFAWIFFRANSISDAFLLIGGLARIDLSTALSASTTGTEVPAVLAPWGEGVGNPSLQMALAFVLVALLMFADWMSARWDVSLTSDSRSSLALPQWAQVLDPQRHAFLRWAVYLVLALAIMNLGVSQAIPFVYMQF